MIKSYTAYTEEIDDAEEAVADIIGQLNPEQNRLKYTAAVVVCYHEFATDGVIAQLYKELQFPIIGTTTTSHATNGGIGQLGLSVLMITSDDTVLTAACSPQITNDLPDALKIMYEQALIGHTEKPKLIISAAPLMLNYAGDHFVQILDSISGGVPNFGTQPIDLTSTYQHSHTIFNDKVEKNIYAAIVASGNISPKFFYSSFSPEFILNQRSTITKAENNLIIEVDGKPIVEYMESIGLAKDGNVSNILHSIPFVLDYRGDGLPVSRVLLAWSGDGKGICGGLMPEGVQFNIAAWDKDDMLSMSEKTIKTALSEENISTMMIHCCLARIYALGIDHQKEFENAKNLIGNKVPYVISYSGGEICPTGYEAGHNSFHNNTIVICAF